MIHRRSMIGALAAVLLLAGCAGTPETARLTQSPPPGVPQRAELEAVPFFAQEAYHCGPAALAAALNFSGLSVTPDGIADQVYTPGRTGTLQMEILTGSRRNGRIAVEVRTMRDGFREVAAGHPVLILQNLGLEMAPQWHYALLVGFDLEAETAILRSGTTRRLEMPLQTLEHTWRRGDFWGVVVAAPEGPVPATASFADWLDGAVGLERAGDAAQAATAYATAAARWPGHAEPYIAIAGLYAAEGQLLDAAASLRKALDRADAETEPVVLNNLAYVLMQQEQWDEAEALAERAVAAGGAFRDSARETLIEIRENRPDRKG
ncbi:MAG: PA2778 family cysteine peptidase [Rhodospirillales bacterium]